MKPRQIIHLDMDCFFAAIEVRDQPALRGQPVAVGGDRFKRGVLTTCNYEARTFGVRSAMPTWQALRLCPHLVVVPVRFEAYRRESERIRALMAGYTAAIEPLSLDEAYMDVTDLGRPAAGAATELRRRIRRTTGLSASAGIAPNKLVAKIASDWNKPNGQFEVKPEDVAAFMRDLPVHRIWGVGRVAAGRLEQLGITTCGQLQALPVWRLQELFGRFGTELWHLCRGEDDRPVEPHRERKSLGTECTFARDLRTLDECLEHLASLQAGLMADLRKHGEARRITGVFVKLKFSDFKDTTVARTGAQPEPAVFRELLATGFGRSGRSVRLLGLGVRFAEESSEEETQLELPLGNS